VNKYLRVYGKMCPGNLAGHDAKEKEDIEREMRAIEKAATLEEAEEVIRWWGGWGGRDSQQGMTCRAWVRRARALMRARS